MFDTSLALAEQASVESVKGGLTAMENWRSDDYLSSLELPCLILWGDQDKAYPFAQEMALWQGIANANLAVIPNAGHNVHHEKPALFSALVNDFLGSSNF